MMTYIFSILIVFPVIFILALLNKNIMNLLITTNDINFFYIKIVVMVIFIVNAFILTLGYFINIKQLKNGVNVE